MPKPLLLKAKHTLRRSTHSKQQHNSALRFPGACFAYAVFLITGVMMSPDAHAGTRLGAVAAFLGATLVAIVPAGALVRRGWAWHNIDKDRERET